jgi:hypothetical protein
MSNEPISSTSSATEASGASETEATSSTSGSKKLDAETAATQVSSIEDLKLKAPKLFDATLMAIAQRITSEMHHHQERLKEIMRRGQAND